MFGDSETLEFQIQSAMKSEKQEREVSSLPGVRTGTKKRSSSEDAEYLSPGSKVKKMAWNYHIKKEATEVSKVKKGRTLRLWFNMLLVFQPTYSHKCL